MDSNQKDLVDAHIAQRSERGYGDPAIENRLRQGPVANLDEDKRLAYIAQLDQVHQRLSVPVPQPRGNEQQQATPGSASGTAGSGVGATFSNVNFPMTSVSNARGGALAGFTSPTSELASPHAQAGLASPNRPIPNSGNSSSLGPVGSLASNAGSNAGFTSPLKSRKGGPPLTEAQMGLLASTFDSTVENSQSPLPGNGQPQQQAQLPGNVPQPQQQAQLPGIGLPSRQQELLANGPGNGQFLGNNANGGHCLQPGNLVQREPDDYGRQRDAALKFEQQNGLLGNNAIGLCSPPDEYARQLDAALKFEQQQQQQQQRHLDYNRFSMKSENDSGAQRGLKTTGLNEPGPQKRIKASNSEDDIPPMYSPHALQNDIMGKNNGNSVTFKGKGMTRGLFNMTKHDFDEEEGLSDWNWYTCCLLKRCMEMEKCIVWLMEKQQSVAADGRGEQAPKGMENDGHNG